MRRRRRTRERWRIRNCPRRSSAGCARRTTVSIRLALLAEIRAAQDDLGLTVPQRPLARADEVIE